MWHEVGVGKTCAAIGIAENFRDFANLKNTKILVLTPSDTLKGTWRNEIFNVEKEIQKYKSKSNKNVQCTGNKYLKGIINIPYDNAPSFQRKINKIINKYYEFMGYGQLANWINKNMNSYLGRDKNNQKKKIQWIKNKFSNRVIIMDEVHVTRESSNKTDKAVRPWLEMIARYSENTKIILLSATPMYNISREIIWIINLLLWNDNRAPIIEGTIFDTKGLQFINNGKRTIRKLNQEDIYPMLGEKILLHFLLN